MPRTCWQFHWILQLVSVCLTGCAAGTAHQPDADTSLPMKLGRIQRLQQDGVTVQVSINDGQVIFYDQFLPNSALLAYLNADHWAAAVPIARTHDVAGKLLVDRNAYPREALYEALLRLIEEDLEKPGDPSWK